MDAAQPGLPGISGQGSNGSSNACLHCRKVKMRCRLENLATHCERCRRKGLDCSFLQHRRGRKRHHAPSSSNPSRKSGQHSSWTALDGHTSSALGIGQAPAGRFSLESILTTDQDVAASRSARESSVSSEDPISKGLLNQAVATNLFDRCELLDKLSFTTDVVEASSNTSIHSLANSTHCFTAWNMSGSSLRFYLRPPCLPRPRPSTLPFTVS